MMTLSRATSLTKTVAKWSTMTIVSIVLIMALFRIGIAVKERLFPTPLPPPTVAFGKLPTIEFPQNAGGQQFSFSIDTLTGKLPSFPDRAKAYKVASNKPDLLALQKAKEKVSRVGFLSNPIRLSESIYQWTDSTPSARKISLNIFSSDFILSSPFLWDQTVTSGINLPNQNSAKGIAQSFLSDMSSFPNDIDSDKTTTSLFSIKNYTLVPATSLSSAQIIKVDFFQKNIDKMPIYYSHANASNMNVFVGGGDSQAQVVKIDFSHQSISSDFATYPIKTSIEAFSELKSGKAYIASYSSGAGDSNISIKNAFLGYYIGEKKQDYLMPIIIFTGDHDFFAYVSAIKDVWISN